MNIDYVPDFQHCLLPYVQWYQDDFVGGVRGMKAHEIGIYTMLLMEMYARGHALDMPADRLARLCGSDKRTFEKTLDLLLAEGKIIRLNCGLWNERCENAFRSRAKMQGQQSGAGVASARKRSKNNEAGQRPFSDRSTGVQPSSEAQNTIKETPIGVSKKRGVRLAPDWQCPEEWIKEAIDAGLPRKRAISEAERMKNWSLSTPKGAKLDWLAAWRNWYKGKLEDQQRPPGGRDADGHLTNSFLFGGRH